MAASKPESSQNMAPDDAEVTSEPQGQLVDSAGISVPLQPPEMAVAFPLVRQSSIYSLTLDEIQNTVCEPGKNFGSMNMDEFLNNIWNVEDGFEAAEPTAQAQYPAPLNRQGSVALPSHLCRKTVDEVWAEIHREQEQQGRKRQQQKQNNGGATRKPTFGEMTLEDFLIKAGVVSEGYGLTGCTMGANGAPAFGHVYGCGAVVNGGRGDLYCCAGDAGGGFPASPISSDGKSESGGRKRMAEGVVEKVVERRQRRMIKNRESAARSRARKQAYTVELETELNHLKQENALLREEERRVRQMRKQMLLEAMAKQTQHNMDKTSSSFRRCNSSPS